MKISRFEDLDCWQEARKLVRTVYEVTNNGVFKRDLRLCGQIQAAATSEPPLRCFGPEIPRSKPVQSDIRTGQQSGEDYFWLDYLSPHQRNQTNQINQMNEINQMNQTRRFEN